ncbi:hypothetical protein [Methylocucumis oryzae]|uniref:hypothetical protein n=1 Tax=Methylocucumis oryzae TaxID=1632867 RepID=UPI000697D8AC|nr:hypothetical protein [Methylocucumis oryzae]
MPSWIPGLGNNKASKAAKAIHAIVDNVIAKAEQAGLNDTLLAQFLKLQSAKSDDVDNLY